MGFLKANWKYWKTQQRKYFEGTNAPLSQREMKKYNQCEYRKTNQQIKFILSILLILLGRCWIWPIKPHIKKLKKEITGHINYQKCLAVPCMVLVSSPSKLLFWIKVHYEAGNLSVKVWKGGIKAVTQELSIGILRLMKLWFWIE
jgi:hypothetical protein